MYLILLKDSCKVQDSNRKAWHSFDCFEKLSLSVIKWPSSDFQISEINIKINYK